VQENQTVLEGTTPSLLRSVAEQLKLPLATIARQAELAELTGDLSTVDVATLQTQAVAALALVDSYLLGLQLAEGQTELTLEPVSVSSLLVDVAHELDKFARQHGTGLRLHIGGKYEPVMAHQAGLRSALLTTGYALIENYPKPTSLPLTLAVHRTPKGIVTGVYGDYDQLGMGAWRRALDLQGRATQPIPGLTGGNGAGLFIAEAILRAMATKLRVGKYLRQYGLATTLQPSQQLQFV
jgi:hypothetical protein